MSHKSKRPRTRQPSPRVTARQTSTAKFKSLKLQNKQLQQARTTRQPKAAASD